MLTSTVINPSAWSQKVVDDLTADVTSANNGVTPDSLAAALEAAQTALAALTDTSGPQQVILNDDGTATVTTVEGL